MQNVPNVPAPGDNDRPDRAVARGRWRAWLELTRLSNLPSVWGNLLAGALLVGGWAALAEGSGNGPSVGEVLAAAWDGGLGWALLAGSLMYLAGMVMNDAKDADWDRRHRPERPIPSGRVARGNVWLAGWLLWGGGLAAGWLVADGRWWLAALAVAVVSYTFSHKKWAGSVLLMAACRGLLVLLGASTLAGAGAPDWFQATGWWPVAGAALALSGYVAGLTLMARGEARGGRVPLAAWVLLLLAPAWGVLLLAGPAGSAGPTALATTVALVTLLGWVIWVRLRRRREGPPSTGAAVGRLLAGMPLVDALAVSLLSLPATVLFCLAPPLLRLWQRWVAAT